MRTKTLLSSFFLLLQSLFYLETALAQKMIVEGTFNGQELYFIQGFRADSSGWCIQQFLVNGIEIPDHVWSSSAFKVDLDSLVSLGDSLIIQIEHGSECSPRLLPYENNSRNRAQFDSIYITEQGRLFWTVNHQEKGRRNNFFVQRWQCGSWVHLQDIPAQNKGLSTSYSVSVPLASGHNFYRVVEHAQYPRDRNFIETSFVRNTQRITTTVSNDSLRFSQVVEYRLWNLKTGQLLRKGSNEEIVFKGIRKGNYLLYYGNQVVNLKWHKGIIRLDNLRIDSPGFTG